MRIALLISGEPRTIVFKEQIRFFTNLIHSLENQGYIVDTYCMFKLKPTVDFINSEEGLINLDTLLKILNPKHLEFFYKFNDEEFIEKKFKSYYPKSFCSQIRMIDSLIKKAIESNLEYDFFLRIRPDCVLNGSLDMKSFNDSTVYSSIKCDAVGNDQMFLCHRNMINIWWIPIIRPSVFYFYHMKPDSTMSPDYFIFYHCSTKQIIESGLIRDYNVITAWIHHREDKLILNNYWAFHENYLLLKKSIRDEDFIEKLNPILLKYKGTLKLMSIPV
jgi:hypothetical protein